LERRSSDVEFSSEFSRWVFCIQKFSEWNIVDTNNSGSEDTKYLTPAANKIAYFWIILREDIDSIYVCTFLFIEDEFFSK
jgi:hypothetical protein